MIKPLCAQDLKYHYYYVSVELKRPQWRAGKWPTVGGTGRMFSMESLSAWAVAGVLFYMTMPKKPKELSKKDVEDANREKLYALGQSQKKPEQE